MEDHQRYLLTLEASFSNEAACAVISSAFPGQTEPVARGAACATHGQRLSNFGTVPVVGVVVVSYQLEVFGG
jgi:hypothetical protein